MAKVHLKALDFIIVASHYAASGKPKKALAALEMAADEEDFEDTLTTLDAGNSEGWEDGEGAEEEALDLEDEEAEEELSRALSSLKRSRRRRVVAAEDSDSDDDLDEDAAEDADDEDDTEVEESASLRKTRRERNLRALARRK